MLLFATVEPVGQRGGGRFVDDPLHSEARQLAGLASRLAGRIGEVGRNRDPGPLDRLAQLLLGALLQLAQDQRRDLLRAILAVAQSYANILAHLALDRAD